MTESFEQPPHEQLRALFTGRGTHTIYDVFDDVITSVQAAYVAATAAAEFDAERNLWADRSVALRHYRQAINPDDRDAVIAAIALLNEELRFLHNQAARRRS